MNEREKVMRVIRPIISGLNKKWVFYNGYETMKVSVIARLIDNKLEQLDSLNLNNAKGEAEC